MAPLSRASYFRFFFASDSARCLAVAVCFGLIFGRFEPLPGGLERALEPTLVPVLLAFGAALGFLAAFDPDPPDFEPSELLPRLGSSAFADPPDLRDGLALVTFASPLPAASAAAA